jgi:hypothetical protein
LIGTFGRAGGGPAGKISKTEPGLAGLVGSIPGLEAFGDAFDSPYPKFQTENYVFGSQLANIIEFGRTIDGQFAPKTLFESDLQTTDNSPIKDSQFGDGDSVLSDKQPYPNFNPFEAKQSPLDKRNPDSGFTEGYPQNQGLQSLNDSFRPNDDTSDSGFGGDKHTLLDFGISDTELSERLGRTQYLDKIEDAHPNASNDGTIEGIGNGMPFYFKDMRDGAYLFFRAYIEGLSENISPTYNSTQYIGRSEPVYTYGQTERDVNFTLKLFAQTKDELNMIYKKMNKLTSMCYPEYFKDLRLDDDGIARSYGNRMKPPLTKLRIGELYGNSQSQLMGYIKSLSYSIDQASPFETEVGKRVPMHIVANIAYQVIHSETPNLETKFYGYIGG